jgi:hypothetical protein
MPLSRARDVCEGVAGVFASGTRTCDNTHRDAPCDVRRRICGDRRNGGPVPAKHRSVSQRVKGTGAGYNRPGSVDGSRAAVDSEQDSGAEDCAREGMC